MKKIFVFVLLLFQYTLYAQTLPDSYIDGKYVTVNGAKLYVVVVGKGDPLIIIPGGPVAPTRVTVHLIHWQKITSLFFMMPLAGAKVTRQKM